MRRPSPTGAPRRPARSMRPVAAAVAAAGMIFGALIVPAAATADTASDGLLVDYRFDQTSGSTVANLAAGSAFGAATVESGVDGQWADGALTFTGANWVRLPDALLSGKESATITTEVKIDASMKNTNHFLWNIGNAQNQAYLFANAKDTPRTAITTGSGGGEVNARAVEDFDADRWYSLTTVVDGAADQIRLYIDGRQVGSAATTLTPASITDQSLNTIARSPWNDPLFKGSVSHFRVFDRALASSEISAISDADAQTHPEGNLERAQQVLTGLDDPVVISDSTTTLPDLNGRVRWSTDAAGATVDADGTTLRLTQPPVGSTARDIPLTAAASVRGSTATRVVTAKVQPEPASDDHYGYLLVHFIEDPQGYAEKIYLDVSRGNDPEQWDPLNGGKPILASALGTTGVRDPYITRNPDTGKYYIIATDLRVFGGDGRDGAIPGCDTWCYWEQHGSNDLIVWESDDLVTWSAPRTVNVAPPGGRLGMAWAPEATWVADYDGAGKGAFVVYWSSRVAEGGDQYSSGRILWGATTDFTQSTFSYGGTLLDEGGFTIDATLLQHDGKTYRVAKDQSFGKGVYMDATDSPTWWKSDTRWTRVQERIGANYGNVEGPAGFKRNDADQWYLYVDVIPQTGYRPMTTANLDQGFTPLDDKSFFMTPSTKHGGILGLTKAEYDRVRAADATAAVASDLGEVRVDRGGDAAAALPPTTEVTTAYGRGTQSLPVTWDVSGVDTATDGTYAVTGVVRSIGANDNDWVGAGGSTLYTAPDKRPFSNTEVTVTAKVVVASASPSPSPTPTSTPSPTPTASASPSPDTAPTAAPAPSATLSAPTVAQGGTVTVTVAGLTPGTQIGAELHSDPIVITGIPAADAAGAVRFAVRVPTALPTGAHTIVVLAADGTELARLPLRVTAAGALASTGAANPLAAAGAGALLLVVGAAVGLRVRSRRAVR